MQDQRRLRLIERIRLLPACQLGQIEQALDSLAAIGSVSNSGVKYQTSRLPKPQTGSLESANTSGSWPHAPLHRLSDHGTFFVTGGTLHKEHRFRGRERLSLLETAVREIAEECGWRLEAWAVFSNHYHLVAHALAGAVSLDIALKRLHGRTALSVNRLDGVSERHVWYNYWDTQLTHETSYLARLNYVHQNPVRHSLVPVASQYPWCSASWFERTATRAQVRTIYSFRTDRLKVYDDFEPVR